MKNKWNWKQKVKMTNEKCNTIITLPCSDRELGSYSDWMEGKNGSGLTFMYWSPHFIHHFLSELQLQCLFKLVFLVAFYPPFFFCNSFLLNTLFFPPPLHLLQVQTNMPVHHSPQAVWLCGVGLHLLQLHHSGSGEAQDTTGQLGKSIWNVYVHVLVYVEATAPVSHFWLVGLCILRGQIQFYYLKGAVRKLLLPLITPSPPFDCQSHYLSVFLALASGKSLSHHLQLHLYCHLCGRDDTQGNILQLVSITANDPWV